MINAGADAVIVGSAIIDKISDPPGKKMLQDIENLAKYMKKGCKKKYDNVH
jgi:tryptophan synthase alpha subunit